MLVILILQYSNKLIKTKLHVMHHERKKRLLENIQNYWFSFDIVSMSSNDMSINDTKLNNFAFEFSSKNHKLTRLQIFVLNFRCFKSLTLLVGYSCEFCVVVLEELSIDCDVSFLCSARGGEEGDSWLHRGLQLSLRGLYKGRNGCTKFM